MKNNILSSEEISILKQFNSYRIPEIFKYELLDYLLEVENIHMFVEDLLKNKIINYNLEEEFFKLQNIIKSYNLINKETNYFNDLIKVYEIYKKNFIV